MLVKTLGGKNEAEVFFSTNENNSPTQIINWFVLRWNIEVTFEESRAHLGIETQRQWSDNAIQRSTLWDFQTLVEQFINTCWHAETASIAADVLSRYFTELNTGSDDCRATLAA